VSRYCNCFSGFSAVDGYVDTMWMRVDKVPCDAVCHLALSEMLDSNCSDTIHFHKAKTIAIKSHEVSLTILTCDS
jgi:hypothetical protein